MSAPFRITVDVDARSVKGMVEGLEYALSGLGLDHYLMTYVQPSLRLRAVRRFASEGDAAVGGKWFDLAPYTQHVRALAGYGAEHPINKRTGELERFITRGTNIHAYTATSATLIMPGGASGTLEEKLMTAQQGSSSPVTPARPVIAVDMLDMVTALSTLHGWLVDNARARD